MRRCLIALVVLVLAPPAGAATRGGSVRLLSNGDVDYLDPGQTYYGFGYAVQFAVSRALFGYAPGSLALRPDLAAGPAAVSRDRRTVTVHLRSGVRYAPPVGREVAAADVKYAIERAFSLRVPSAYAIDDFGVVEGTPARASRRIPSIGGIRTPDAHTLVFRLRRPVGGSFAKLLALPITVPVPREYARRYDRARRSTYNRHVAFTGPYRVSRYRPGRSIVLTRNPNWDPATDFRPARLDAITIEEGHADLRTSARQALRGRRTLCCGDAARAPGVRPTATAPGLGTHWTALNTQVASLDRVAVRRAVVAAVDRRRLARLSQAPLAQHFLPPGIPGHDRVSLRGLDFLAHPGGSLRVARRYLRGAHIRPSRFRPLLMVSLPGRSLAAARLVARPIRRLGLRVRIRIVSPDTLYTRWCGVPRRRVAICPGIGWVADTVDPETFLRPTFDGRRIRRAGNVNWSQLRAPSIDRAMDRAATATGSARAAAWGRIDRRITALAPAIPYGWDPVRGYASRDLDAVLNSFTQSWDLSFTGLR